MNRAVTHFITLGTRRVSLLAFDRQIASFAELSHTSPSHPPPTHNITHTHASHSYLPPSSLRPTFAPALRSPSLWKKTSVAGSPASSTPRSDAHLLATLPPLHPSALIISSLAYNCLLLAHSFPVTVPPVECSDHPFLSTLSVASSNNPFCPAQRCRFLAFPHLLAAHCALRFKAIITARQVL